MHADAPVAFKVFVTAPAEHTLQNDTLEAKLYVPAAHGTHVVAPDRAPVFVMDPAAQLAHAICEKLLNVPATHGVHVEAPEEVNVFVTEPAAQIVQLESPATAA